MKTRAQGIEYAVHVAQHLRTACHYIICSRQSARICAYRISDSTAINHKSPGEDLHDFVLRDERLPGITGQAGQCIGCDLAFVVETQCHIMCGSTQRPAAQCHIYGTYTPGRHTRIALKPIHDLFYDAACILHIVDPAITDASRRRSLFAGYDSKVSCILIHGSHSTFYLGTSDFNC